MIINLKPLNERGHKIPWAGFWIKETNKYNININEKKGHTLLPKFLVHFLADVSFLNYLVYF